MAAVWPRGGAGRAGSLGPATKARLRARDSQRFPPSVMARVAEW